MAPIGCIRICKWCDRIQIGAACHEKNPHLVDGTTLAK